MGLFAFGGAWEIVRFDLKLSGASGKLLEQGSKERVVAGLSAILPCLSYYKQRPTASRVEARDGEAASRA